MIPETWYKSNYSHCRLHPKTLERLNPMNQMLNVRLLNFKEFKGYEDNCEEKKKRNFRLIVINRGEGHVIEYDLGLVLAAGLFSNHYNPRHHLLGLNGYLGTMLFLHVPVLLQSPWKRCEPLAFLCYMKIYTKRVQAIPSELWYSIYANRQMIIICNMWQF